MIQGVRRQGPGPKAIAMWLLLSAVALGAGTTGCSVILRAAGIPVGDTPADGASSPLSPGHFVGDGECEILVLVELEEPVSEIVPLTLDVVVDDEGRPARNGRPYDTSARADLPIDRFTIELTVAGAIGTPEMFVVNLAAALTVDPDSAFPIEMFGEAAETYTPGADGSIAYAFAADLVEHDDAGATLSRSMAVQCQATLSRQ